MTGNCHVCGGREHRPLFTVSRYQRDYRLVGCRHCGLVFVDPRPSSAELTHYYDQIYNYDLFMHDAESIRKRGREDVAWIQQFKTAGRLLEVGCMYGFMLEQAQRQGFACYGIEISDKAAQYAREQLGLKVHTGRVEERPFDDGRFDVIYLSHLIEHLEDPLGTVRVLYQQSADNGLLLLKCPNFGSLMRKLTGKQWWWIAPPEHLFHFTPASIRNLLTRAGYRDIEVTTSTGDLRYLRYGWFYVASLFMTRKRRARYREYIDTHPDTLCQRILLKLYRGMGWLIHWIHRANLGEEMIVIAKK